jgi:hypothetical protein
VNERERKERAREEKTRKYPKRKRGSDHILLGEHKKA